MKKFIKNNYKYILSIPFFLIILIFLNYLNADTIWNYGMAHSIKIHELPYKDFNIITTPLYPFIMSLGLILKDSYLTYIIEQAILCSILYFIVDKYLKNKSILYLILISIPFFKIYVPNYNFLVYLLLLITMLLEKNNKSYYLIGFIIGLLFLSKHTIGIVVLFLSIISSYNINKSIKKILGFSIPCIIFLLYLLITKTIYNFIDLSILGLFSFSGNNSGVSTFSIIISISILIFTIYKIYKNKKDIRYYYLLSTFSFIIPIVNLEHCIFLIGIFLLIVLEDYELKNVLKYKYLILIILLIFNISINISYYKNLSNNKLHYFKYRIMTKEDSEYVRSIIKKYKSYKNVIMISMDSMLYDIETNKKISYFDIPLHGNYGYKDIDVLKKKIDNMNDTYIFIQKSNNKQFINEMCDYIKNKSKYIEKYKEYEIYYIS